MITKENILSLLKSQKTELSRIGIRNVGLFGSYLRNAQSSESDIDLLIDFEPGRESFDNLMAASDIFEDLFKDERVDVVTVNGLSPYIGPSILDEVVYA